MKYLLILLIAFVACKGKKELKQHPWPPELLTSDSSNWLMRTQADQNLCRDSSIYITVVGVDALYAPDTNFQQSGRWKKYDSKGDGVTDDRPAFIKTIKEISRADSAFLFGDDFSNDTIVVNPILPLRTLINDPLPELLIPIPDCCQLLRDSIKRLNDKLNTLQ